MSSDRKEPGATWQGPTNSNSTWNSPVEQFPSEEVGEQSPHSTWQQQAAAHHPSTPLPFNAGTQGNNEDALEEPASSPISLLKRVGQYAFLILVPLFFGLITALLVLPQIYADQAMIPPEGFWPVLLLILAITIGQGVTTYFLGSDNGKWITSTVGGFCAFLLLGSFTLYGLLPGFLVLTLLVALGVLAVRRCYHPVPEGMVDIVYAHQKYGRTLYPGFNFLLPWEKVQLQLHVEEVQWMCPAQVVQLSRDEDVILQAIISYQLIPEDAYLAVTQIKNWEESLRILFQTNIQTVAATFTPNDFLIWPDGRHQVADSDNFTGGFERREKINQALFNLMRDKVALWGVQVNWVSLREIYIIPHGSAIIGKNIAHVAPIPSTTREDAAVIAQAPAVEQTTTSFEGPHHGEQPVAHTPPFPPAHHVTPRPSIPLHKLNEEVLINAYKSVQDGKITDPETIRGIAANFEAVARDPQASQNVSFDAARAALNLYDQARKHEEQIMGETYEENPT